MPGLVCPRGCGSRPIRKGFFTTKWNHQPVRRYFCRPCGRGFSSHTGRTTYGQHKPHLNAIIYKLYASATTQRRMARVLSINRKTVVRKFLFMAELARQAHARETWVGLGRVQFDEVLSFEHTRLKPLSLALAVEESSAKILSIHVASMPCHGKMAGISRRKYGFRKDDRPHARRQVLQQIATCGKPPVIVTDAHPAYPRLIQGYLPDCHHIAVKSRKGAKFRPEGSRKNLNDALFTLNHTAAKIRHDLSRMARQVWVTTKKASRLQDHLDLYIAFNNGYPLPSSTIDN